MNFEQFLGWALVHSVWEVAVLAAGLWLFCRFVRSANARYAAAFGALLLCLVAPAVTTLEFQQGRSAVASLDEPAAVTKPLATPPASHEVVFGKTNPSAAVAAPAQLDEAASPGMGERIASAAPGIARLWLLGVMVMALRLLGGIGLLRRVKRGASADADGRWQEMTDSLARRLGLSGKVALRISDAVEAPTVIGITKAIVLLPAGVILRLSPGQIEALLAHEIAHIRRHDLLANFVQSLLEVAMFFHPCAWWISSVIRAEREHCCDDLAIQALGDRAKYAWALVEMEGIRAGTPQLALSAKGGSLPDRIRRIAKGRPRERFVAAPAWATLGVFVLICVTLAQSIYAERRPQATQEVTGQVVYENGNPATGALVFCQTSNRTKPEPTVQQGVAAANGSFRFVVPAEDRYMVTAYVKGKGIGAKYEGQPAQLPVRLMPVSDARVRVRDKAGRPIANVRVGPTQMASPIFMPAFGNALADTQSGVTDANGWATLHDLPRNAWTYLAAYNERYAASSGVVAWPNKTPVVTVAAASKVAGRVTFQGKPVSGVLVAEYSQPNSKGQGGPGSYYWQRTRTDENGRYELKRVTHGSVVVTATIFDGSPSTDHLVAAPVQSVVDPGQTASVDIPLQRCAVVQVKALDVQGKPLTQPFISITDSSNPSITRVAGLTKTPGTFEARLPAGRYTAILQVFKTTSTEPFTVASGERKEIVIQESPQAAGLKETSFQFLSPEGKPVSKAMVDYSLPGKAVANAMTDPQGVAKIIAHEYDLGKVRFVAQKDDLFADATPDRNNFVIRMQRPTLGSVTGLVQDSRGRPVVGADAIISFAGLARRVNDPAQFLGDYSKIGKQRTGPDGRYRFEGIYPGRNVAVLVRAPGLTDGETPTVHVDGGSKVVIPTLRLTSAGVISGRILDKDGSPIVNAQYGVLDAPSFAGRTPKTDAQGNFRQDRVSAGSHVVSIYKGTREIRLRAETGSSKVYVADGKGYARAR